MLADVFTPVGIYLRLRDRFRDTVLLESTDHHMAENSYSFIGINAIAGIEISNTDFIEYKLPGLKAEKISISNPTDVPGHLWRQRQTRHPAVRIPRVWIGQECGQTCRRETIAQGVQRRSAQVRLFRPWQVR